MDFTLFLHDGGRERGGEATTKRVCRRFIYISLCLQEHLFLVSPHGGVRWRGGGSEGGRWRRTGRRKKEALGSRLKV